MARDRSWIGVGAVVIAIAALLVVLRWHRTSSGEADAGIPTDVPVHTGEVVRASLRRTVAAFASVEPQPAGEAVPPAAVTLAASTTGTLVGIDCFEGQRVHAGDVVFRLDSRTAEVDLDRALSELDYAEATLARQRDLLGSGGASEKAVQAAEQQRDAAGSAVRAARTQLELLRVVAPLSGTVVRLDARLGEMVEPSTVLGQLVDLDRLVLSLQVPSREAGLVEIGQWVEAEADRTALGRVTFVGAAVDPAADAVTVRSSLATGAAYRPGQLVPVRIVVEERSCLAVPVDALVSRTGEGSWIMRVEGERAVRTTVAPGIRDGDLVEVRGEGLAEGLPIVTVEAYGLPAEAGIRTLGP